MLIALSANDQRWNFSKRLSKNNHQYITVVTYSRHVTKNMHIISKLETAAVSLVGHSMPPAHSDVAPLSAYAYNCVY